MSLQLNGTAGVTYNDGSNQPAAASPYGLKNLVINGDMLIDQRADGAAVSTITGSASAYDCVDRWQTQKFNLTNTQSLQQVADVPTGSGLYKSLKITSNATTQNMNTTTDSFTIRQRIEGYNTNQLAYGTSSAKTITLSFWVKSSLTGTFSVCISNNFTKSYFTTYTISSANTWEKKTVTIPGDTTAALANNTNGTSMLLMFPLDNGPDFESTSTNAWISGDYRRTSGTVKFLNNASATWQLTGVQLEIGTTATPFENLMYGTQLALCQRYYYKTGGTIRYYKNSANTSAEAWPLGFPVYMRVSPSVSFGTVSTGGNTTSYSVAGASNQSVSIQILANGSAGYARLDAELLADSEL